MLIVRKATEGDLAFVLDSFTKDYARVPYTEGLTRSQVRNLMVTLLSAPGWCCSILCDDEERDEIIAYAVWKAKDVIAWLHVKGIYRRRGMAKRLLNAIGARPGPIRTPNPPGSKLARAARARGWQIHPRPYLDLLPPVTEWAAGLLK